MADIGRGLGSFDNRLEPEGQSGHFAAERQASAGNTQANSERGPHRLRKFFQVTVGYPVQLSTALYMFDYLAGQVDLVLPGSPDKDLVFQKLLEARDAAIRSSILR